MGHRGPRRLGADVQGMVGWWWGGGMVERWGVMGLEKQRRKSMHTLSLSLFLFLTPFLSPFFGGGWPLRLHETWVPGLISN